VQTLAQIRALLDARGLAPRKSLGQNFLIDHNLITRLVEASGVGPGDLVLEVGPGTGALTHALLERGCRVVAGEMDRGLAQLLRETLAEPAAEGRFTLVEGDALESGRKLAPGLLAALQRHGGGVGGGLGGGGGGGGWSMVANLPYHAATPLMLSILAEHPACAVQAVTIQREVADRLLARPGSKDYGTLGIVAQAMAEISLVAKLPPECFWPRPEVTSAMVLLRRRAEPLTGDPRGLIGFCQRLFAARRKQLGSTLGRERAWPAGIRPEQRAEELSVEQLIALAATEPAAE
jgi:16S rRNA (adenine1518-N6/adenine1519-N6)-dimethyltransferase